MNKMLRFLRFNFITKLLLRNKWIDYLIRRFFIRRLHDRKNYCDTSNHALAINKELNPILKKYKGFLGHGVALSIIRDNKLPDCQDLDYDLYDCTDLKKFITDVQKLGFHLKFKGSINGEVKHMIFSKYNAHIDFFVCDVKDNVFYLNTISGDSVNLKYKVINNVKSSHKYISYSRKMTYSPIEEKIIMNNKFYLPKNYNKYFIEMYGDDWQKAKKYFNWSLYPKNNEPVIVTENIYIEIYDTP